MKTPKRIKTMLLSGISLLLLLLPGCSRNKETLPVDAEVYVTLMINDVNELDVRGKSSEIIGKAQARITTKDIEAPDGAISKKNTLGIVAYNIIDQEAGKAQSLIITIPEITASGTFDFRAKEGLLVYSDSRGGTEDLKGLQVSPEMEETSGTITIEAIGGDDIPGLGKAVKGSFAVTAIGVGGGTATLTGTFNGGI